MIPPRNPFYPHNPGVSPWDSTPWVNPGNPGFPHIPRWPPAPPPGPFAPNPFENVLQHYVPKVEDHPLFKRVQEATSGKSKGLAGLGHQKRTDIVFVLDESTSMAQGKGITVAGYNSQVSIVREQHVSAGFTTMSLVLFGDYVKTQYAFAPVDMLQQLSDASYHPNGMTALYDAIGAAIDLILQSPGFRDKDHAAFIAVFTDGGENISKTCNGPLISRCISMLEETGKVTFSFMGPNEGLSSIKDVLKMAPGNVAGYDPTSNYSRTQAFASMSNATSHYMKARSVGATSVNNLYTGGN